MKHFTLKKVLLNNSRVFICGHCNNKIVIKQGKKIVCLYCGLTAGTDINCYNINTGHITIDSI